MFMTGFEHRQLIAGASPSNGLFSALAGSPTIDTAVFYPGGGSASMKCDSSASAHTVNWGNGGSATGTVCVIFHLRVSSAAALAGTPAAIIVTGVNGNGNYRLDLMNTGALRIFSVTGSLSATSTTLLANDQWYKIMVEFDNTATNLGKMRCYIFDTKEEITVSSILQVTGTFAATNVGNSNSVASTRSVLNFDDVMWYSTAGDYDLLKGIGPYSIVMLNPVGVGTHSTPGSFQDDALATILAGDTTSWSKLNDLPGTVNTTAYVQQVTAGAAYLEYKLAQPPVGVSIIAVRAIMAVFSATTVGNNISFRMTNMAAETPDLQSASVGSTTISFRGNMAQHPPTTSISWAMDEFLQQNARIRVGFSSDISPVPVISAIAAEVAVGNNVGMIHPFDGATNLRRQMAQG
jgi:hypothetical protein